jgi:oxygen-dependent protoporphyrinogen oxidase
VLEGADAVGGKMGSVRRDGFVVNRGAQLLPTAYTATVQMARDVGLGAKLVEFTPTLAVVRNGRQHLIRGSGPGMALDGLRTALLSSRSKLLLRRLALDAFRMRAALTYENHGGRAAWDNETVAEYCERRLNAEIRDYLIDPLMRGLFLVDPLQMSIVDFFFTAVNLLGSTMLRYPAGYDFLARRLAERVGDVRLGTRVERVERTDDGVAVTWREQGGERRAVAGGAVIAVPGPVAPRLYPELDARVREILTREITHSVVIGVHLALARRPREEVVAITVPTRELDGLGAVTFDHIGMPDCAPPGKGLVSAYFSHDWSAPRADIDDERLLAEGVALVERIVPGIGANVEFAQIDRWAPSTPISRRGIHRLTAELQRRCDPRDRVQLAGDYTSIATVNGCVVSGETAAARLAATIQARRTTSTTSSSSVAATTA